MSIITLSIILGTLSFLPMGIGSSISRVPTRSYGLLRLMLVRNTLTSIILFFVLVYRHDVHFFNPWRILLALLLSVLSYVALSFYFKAIATGKLGVISPVASFYAIISLLLSIVFLKVSITPMQIVLIATILLGIMLSSVNFQDFRQSNIFKLSSGVPYALFTAIGWGLFFFLAQIPTRAIGPYQTAFLFELGMLICTAIHILIIKEKIYLPRLTDFNYIVWIAIFNVASTIAMYVGLKSANVPIILALSSATPLVLTAYGVIVYKEKLKPLQYAAVLLVLMGIVGLGYFG